MLHIDAQKFKNRYKEKVKEHFGNNSHFMYSNMNMTYKAMEKYKRQGWAFMINTFPTSTKVTAFHPDNNSIELNCEATGKEKMVLCIMYLLLEGEKLGNLQDVEKTY
jgi:hypothetical protein